jgi:hypothetical protein
MAKRTDRTGGFRFDSSGIMRVLGGIRSSQTGLGTARDKAASIEIAPTQALTSQECQNLCRDSGLLNTIIECYPQDAGKSWASLGMAQQSKTFDADGLWQYMNLKDRVDDVDINNNCKSLRDYFVKVSTQARRYGDAYLLLGIADGNAQDQPVNWEGVESFVGVKICGYATIEGNLYKINNVLWHPDRVLRFCGVPLYDRDGELMPESDSVLQSVFTAYSRWEMGNVSGASMLADYNFLLIGIKGLGLKLQSDVTTGGTLGFQSLLSRLLSVDMNKSVARSVAHDLDNEKIEMVNRTWAGAKEIMDGLERAVIASTNIPSWRMFNEMTGGGLSNTVNTAHLAKADWHDRVNTYKENTWRAPLEYILKIAIHAKDSPTKGQVIDAAVAFPVGSYTSDLEKIQIEKAAADRSKVLIDAGIISPDEARGCYRGNEFNPNITLLQDKAPKPEPEPTGEEEQIIDDFEKTADGATDGGKREAKRQKPRASK